MGESGMTRRALLSATAGALAVGAARPSGALGALLAPTAPRLCDEPIGSLPAGTHTVSLRRNADLVGLQWGTPKVPVLIRARSAHGAFGRWASASACGGDAGEGDPIWTGGTRELEVRTPSPLAGVRVRAVDVSGGVGARERDRWAAALGARALPRALPVLAAGPGQPPILARDAWARGVARPTVAPEYGDVRMAFVHHTENPNGYSPAEVPSMLLAIYTYHRYVRGWDDIGYNFVVDLYGRIFEARAGGIDEPVVGAQAGGYNQASTGVAVLGTFIGVPISRVAREALEALLAWKLALHGVPVAGDVEVRVDPAGASYSRFPAGTRVSLPRIAGHRDADTTECPGNALYGELRSVRSGALKRGGPPTARATLDLAAPAPAESQDAQTAPAWTLSGRLTLLDASPLAETPVAIQERTVSRKGEVVRERTVAQALTNGAGEFSLPVSVGRTRHGGWLRVLYLGPDAGAGARASACVSPPLHTPGPIAPAPVSASPAPVPT